MKKIMKKAVKVQELNKVEVAEAVVVKAGKHKEIINKGVKGTAKPQPKGKKVEKKQAEPKQPRKSISRLVFKFIMDEGLLEKDNRKEKYAELEALVKADFPESRFQRTHFYWYLTRAARQAELKLPTDRLVELSKAEGSK